MSDDFEYGFWFWSNKLVGILTMLSHVANYSLDTIEIESIKHSLIGTNDELDYWINYPLYGQKYSIDLKLAFDSNEHEDMIHIRIKTHNDLKETIKTIDLFQSLFKDLVVENE